MIIGCVTLNYLLLLFIIIIFFFTYVVSDNTQLFEIWNKNKQIYKLINPIINLFKY